MPDPSPPGHITQLLRRVQEGDEAAQEELYDQLYHRLRHLAAQHLRREAQAWTLSPTSLVHEAYLAMAGHEHAWTDRAHTLAVASRAMRHILIDYARKRAAKKRGENAAHVSLDESRVLAVGAPIGVDQHATLLLDLDRALTALAKRDERLGHVIECRIFGGLTGAETAAALGVSAATVERDWVRARAYLHVAIEGAA